MDMVAVKQSELVVKKYAFSFAFPELIRSTSPYTAAFFIFVFNSLYMILIGFCILIVNLLTSSGFGWIIAAIIHIIGYIAFANGGIGDTIEIFPALLCGAGLPLYKWPEDVYRVLFLFIIYFEYWLYLHRQIFYFKIDVVGPGFAVNRGFLYDASNRKFAWYAALLSYNVGVYFTGNTWHTSCIWTAAAIHGGWNGYDRVWQVAADF